MKRLHPLILSIFSGLLLVASWPASSFTGLVFLSLVPLLVMADNIISRRKFLLYIFIAMLTWNTGTTWWIWNSTDVGSIAAMVANSLLMCLPWWGYHAFKQRFGSTPAYGAMVIFWMAFEYIHLNWQLSWPWLSIGNVFAMQTDWIQWYEYTGIGGGTLWVLLVNLLIFHWLYGQANTKKWTTPAMAAVVLLVPIVISWLFYPLINFEKGGRESIVIVQPNIDPYGKFEQSSVAQQVATHLSLTAQAIDSNTHMVIWPETALSANTDMDQVASQSAYAPVFAFLQQHPRITLLSGIETYRVYGTEKPSSQQARKTADGIYYDSYNAAVSIKHGQPLKFYIKSKLVPGVETLPSFLNFLGPVFEQFGGTTGGYATDTAAIALHQEGDGIVAAPIICYESIYGEYVTGYVNKGANLLTIMTNDGWWGNTPGHKQHLQYARLRAIETRRWVVRSANTGISAVINDHGDILDTRAWDTPAAIKTMVPLKTTTTFYTRHGDVLYRAAMWLTVFVLAGWIFIRIRSKWNKKQLRGQQ